MNNNIKTIRANYKADVRFSTPYMIPLLNTTNPETYRHIMLRDKINSVKNSKKNKTNILGYKVKFPKRRKVVIINKKEYQIEYLEKLLFKEKNIFARYNLTYKVWLVIKFLQNKPQI